ncbi:MAG: hypothetical protein ABW063_06750 [Caulobacter sp.]
MTTIEERTLRLQAEGYWAVEIFTAARDHKTVASRHICHAQDDRAACLIASRLTGEVRAQNGFNYYRLALPIRGLPIGNLPQLGLSQPVSQAAWPALMASHAAAEAAFQEHLDVLLSGLQSESVRNRAEADFKARHD